ncbi:hypothetical protein AABM38_14250 [Heyndrickxia sp. MSNUG]
MNLFIMNDITDYIELSMMQHTIKSQVSEKVIEREMDNKKKLPCSGSFD